MNDSSNVFSPHGRFYVIRLEPVDNLNLFQQPCIVQQVKHYPVKWQGGQVHFLQFLAADFLDETGARVLIRVGVVQAIHILDQDEGFTAKTVYRFGK